MFGDDDIIKPVPRFTPLPLDLLGIAELEAYIATLRTEIARVETEIGRKRAVRSAADSVFKLN